MSNTIQTNAFAPPAFLDDAEFNWTQNKKAARASIVSREIDVLNQLSYVGHPCFTFFNARYGDFQPQSFVRQVYWPQNLGATKEGAILVYDRFGAFDAGSFQSGQAIRLTVDNTSTDMSINYGAISSPPAWPTSAQQAIVESTVGQTAAPVEIKIESVTSNGPSIFGGTFAQLANQAIDPSPSGAYVGQIDVHAKGDIVGQRASSVECLAAFLNAFRNVLRYQRPQFGWASVDGNYIEFTTSTQSNRYIFDQTYGAGGTSITSTSPAITLPLMHAAVGIRTQLRVYVFVYAAMSGATDTGKITIANKDSGGTMGSPAALTNDITVNSTTFMWYPTLSTWATVTSPYFNAYAGSTFDRVAICGRSTGATDKLRIAAFTLIPMHATT